MSLFLVIGQRSNGIKNLAIRIAMNYNQPTCPDAHPSLQIFGLAQYELLSSHTQIGVKPQHIAAQLQQICTLSLAFPLLSCIKYNARHQLTCQQLHGCTPIKCLLRKLATYEYLSRQVLDTDESVIHLFLTSCQPHDLHHLYVEVLLLDGTNKTNKYGLYLLYVVKDTGVRTYILVCCVLITSEIMENSGQVLRMLQEIKACYQREHAIVSKLNIIGI